ncbi:hypothetical protein ACP70R_002894 [Stipagrostis hirtigluma subsp. patula]
MDGDEAQSRFAGAAAGARRRRPERCRSVSDDALARPPSFRMDDLPEEIQLLVMSLLPLEEAVRASTVWRNWGRLWTRYPNLCFDGTKYQSTDEHSAQIGTMEFLDMVKSVVRQHSGVRLNKFSIRCCLHKESSDHLKAARTGVRYRSLQERLPEDRASPGYWEPSATEAEDVGSAIRSGLRGAPPSGVGPAPVQPPRCAPRERTGEDGGR